MTNITKTSKRKSITTSLLHRFGKTFTLALLVMIMLSSCGSWHSQIVWQTSPSADESVQIIKLVQSNKLVLIEGEADGETGYFIFDTGAPGLVLNVAHFQDYWTDPKNTVTGVNGEVHQARKRTTKELRLGAVNFHKQWADVIDLSHIERSRNIKILGLLGVNLFRGEKMEIDLKNRELRLIRINKDESPGFTPVVEKILMPWQYHGNLITLKARINDRIYRIAFDTGSETLLMDKSVLTRDNIQSSLLSTKNLLGTDGSGSAIEVRELDKIRIGVSLNKVKMIATDLKRLHDHGLSVDGLIGYDLLAFGIVSIDFNNHTLQISPYDQI